MKTQIGNFPFGSYSTEKGYSMVSLPSNNQDPILKNQERFLRNARIDQLEILYMAL